MDHQQPSVFRSQGLFVDADREVIDLAIDLEVVCCTILAQLIQFLIKKALTRFYKVLQGPVGLVRPYPGFMKPYKAL